MLLFVGLGNPGERYAGNRHNIGFMAVQAIAQAPRHRAVAPALPGRRGGRRDRRRKGAAAAARHLHERVRAARWRRRCISTSSACPTSWCSTTRLELPPGKVRVKTGGGNAGHNGLRSITAHVGNDYRRVRIGIGHPGDKELVQRYVLQDFAKGERPWVEALCEIIADNAGLLAKGKDASFQNKVHLAMGAKGFGDRTSADDRMTDVTTRTFHGIQMRHRRPAECRQVDALQCADADRGGAGGELSVLHHRAECRRGRGARSAARQARGARQVGSRSCRRG